LHVITLKPRLIICLLIIVYSTGVFACVYNVRDVGFADILSSPYILYYFITDNTPDTQLTAFKSIAHSVLMETNVSFEIINIERNKDHPANEFIKFWDVRFFPAAIVASPFGQSRVLQITSEHQTFNASALKAVESVVSSPVRGEVLQHIIKAYAVVVLIEGIDARENKAALKVIKSANNEIKRIMPQLPKTIENPPHLITVEREKLSQEKLLLWSLGINAEDLNVPHAAIFYGRGRRFGPVLKGEGISTKNIYMLLSIIGLSCECGIDRLQLMGTTIPLQWDSKKKSEVLSKLGFDAENPMVKTEMMQIMSLGYGKSAREDFEAERSEEAFRNYDEMVMQLGTKQKTGRITPAQLSEMAASDRPKGLSIKKTLLILSLIAMLIIVAGFIILVQRKRSQS